MVEDYNLTSVDYIDTVDRSIDRDSMSASHTASNLCKCKRINVNSVTLRLMYTDPCI
jgi:hypothetical protein